MSQTTIDSFFKVVPKAGKKKKGLITDYYPVQSITHSNKPKAKSNSKKKPKNLKQTKMTDYFQPAPPMGAISTPRKYLSSMVGALKAIPGGKIISAIGNVIPYVKKGWYFAQDIGSKTTNRKRELKRLKVLNQETD